MTPATRCKALKSLSFRHPLFWHFAIALLVYVILSQRQARVDMVAKGLAQEASVETERNMTAYFAHELRNPLGAIDNALSALPDNLPESSKELISGMQLCTAFMSSIMNNVSDAKKDGRRKNDA
jgi:signal transduction histidine kinase